MPKVAAAVGPYRLADEVATRQLRQDRLISYKVHGQRSVKL